MPGTILPELKTDHLVRMTDCTGIIQHAVYSLPDRSTGYTTDDNARALIAALKVFERTRHPRALELAERYLAFLAHAQNRLGKYRNFVDYSRRFLEDEGSEDSFGRATWACGVALSAGPDLLLARNAYRLIESSWRWMPLLNAPRARAFALVGLYHLIDDLPGNLPVQAQTVRLADSLVRQYRRYSGPGWRWFEDLLAYSNGVLPMSLFLAYRATGRKAYLAVAVESLSFLTDVLFADGGMRLVGNRGWFCRGGERALFDEQPEDAGLMVLAYVAAAQATGKDEYFRLAEEAFAWFLGRNAHGCSLYEPRTGGCYDGLTPEGVNENQGAESLLAYLLAYLALLEVRSEQEKGAAISLA